MPSSAIVSVPSDPKAFPTLCMSNNATKTQRSLPSRGVQSSIKLELARVERRKACVDFLRGYVWHRGMSPSRTVILVNDAGTDALEVIAALHETLRNPEVADQALPQSFCSRLADGSEGQFETQRASRRDVGMCLARPRIGQ